MFGEQEAGAGFGELGFEFAGVEFGEQIAFFDRRAFLEIDRVDHAGNLRPQFGAFVGGDAADEADGFAQRHHGDGHDLDGLHAVHRIRRAGGAGGGGFFAAGENSTGSAVIEKQGAHQQRCRRHGDLDVGVLELGPLTIRRRGP